MPKAAADPYAALFSENESDTPITIRDIVYKRLREAIVTGKLHPGQRLVESKIAQLLNVSRTPLREAIRVLEQERLLERLTQGGVRVPDVSIEEIGQLNEVRASLEALAAYRAGANVRAGTLSDVELQILEELTGVVKQMKTHLADQDVLALLHQGQRFHELIHELSRNRVCAEMLGQLIGAMARYRALVPPGRNTIAVAEHEQIVDAIRLGDASLAATLMRKHIDSAGDLYIVTIQQLMRSRLEGE